MCILWHKWKPHLKTVPRYWVQHKMMIFPSLFVGPPQPIDVPGVGYFSTLKLVGFRCSACGKRKEVSP